MNVEEIKRLIFSRKTLEEILDKVDYIINAWLGWWKPSVLIDFVWDKVIER